MNQINISINWESVKEKIFLRLVNYEKNKENMKGKICIKFLDLAILLYCDCDEWDIGGFYVSKEQLLMWNRDIKDIFQVARKNTYCRDNTFVTPITNFFSEEPVYTGQDVKDIMVKEKEIMVLTNQSFTFGAAMLLNIPELKRLAAQLDSNLYLLPCSVHEILAIGLNQKLDVSCLAEIVNDVNSKGVEPEEYLSNHVYYFNRERCEVTIAVPA